MTGVAAQMCGTADETLKHRFRAEIGKDIEFGARHAILNDLSPAATFISSNYNTATNAQQLKEAFESALRETEKEFGWVYEVEHTEDIPTSLAILGTKGRINFIVWSDVFICPNCGKEIVFWDEAVDLKKGKIGQTFNVDIILKDTDIAHQLYRTTFRQESLDEILCLLRLTAPIRYEYSNRKVDASSL